MFATHTPEAVSVATTNRGFRTRCIYPVHLTAKLTIIRPFHIAYWMPHLTLNSSIVLYTKSQTYSCGRAAA